MEGEKKKQARWKRDDQERKKQTRDLSNPD